MRRRIAGETIHNVLPESIRSESSDTLTLCGLVTSPGWQEATFSDGPTTCPRCSILAAYRDDPLLAEEPK